MSPLDPLAVLVASVLMVLAGLAKRRFVLRASSCPVCRHPRSACTLPLAPASVARSCRRGTLRAMAQVLSILLTGFITGALARFAVPGPDPMPAWLTVLIGLAGSLAGFGVVYAVEGHGDPAWTGIAGFLGSIALVLAYRRFVQKRAIWGNDAYRFPERGFGVPEYRERLQRAGIDPDTVGSPFSIPQQPVAADAPAAPSAAVEQHDPTDNPAHFLGLLEELYDSGVLDDAEYDAARTRLLNRLRA